MRNWSGTRSPCCVQVYAEQLRAALLARHTPDGARTLAALLRAGVVPVREGGSNSLAFVAQAAVAESVKALTVTFEYAGTVNSLILAVNVLAGNCSHRPPPLYNVKKYRYALHS